MSYKIALRGACVIAGLLSFVAGCSESHPEGNMPPPKPPMTPEERKAAIESIEAGRGNMGPGGVAPAKK